jgi:hypothetical protein
MAPRCPQGLQRLFGPPLRYAVTNRRHTEDAYPPVLLGSLYRSHRRGQVTPRRHTMPALGKIVLEGLRKGCKGLRLPSRATLLGFAWLVRLPYSRLGTSNRLGLIHWLLPSWVGPLRKLRAPGPCAPPPFPRLHRSYAPVRPWAPPRDADARGTATGLAPLASGRQVPTCHAAAHVTCTPPPCRPPPSQ